jgi:polysaccharide export outer membrane protein
MRYPLFRMLPLLMLIFLISSCANPCYDCCTEGPEEFVIDSYKIRQGKLSILEMQGIELHEITPEDLQEYKDLICEDDILNIAIYHPKRKDLMEAYNYINTTIGFRVANGRIDLIDLPPIEVAGLTLEKARDRIMEAYSEQIHDLGVFISYKDRLSRKVELAGMVQVPYIPVDGKIRLFETLSKANVPINANFFMSYLVRNGCPMAIDFQKLLVEGDMSQNIVMRGGDKIFIASPQEARAMVMGEVAMPTAVPLPYGSISLREALVTAGGIPYTGNSNCILVIRGGIPTPRIYRLSWKHIIHLPNESLLLIPGDTVYVSEKPITEWNRFISQLLPSVSSLQAGFGTYRTIIPVD